MTKTPNPGSSEAIKQGCICLVDDNGHGFGAYSGIKDASGQPLFLVNSDCPLHGNMSGTDVPL